MITVSSWPSPALIWTGYGAFILIGWNAVLVPTLIRSIERDFHQSDATFGLFFLLSALMYAAGSFFGGLISERLGRKAVLSVAMLSMGFGLLGEALAPVWIVLLAFLPLTGWGAGAIDGGVNGLFLDLYQQARGGAMNVLHLFFSIGALISPLAVGRLLAAGSGWRSILFTTGLASLGLAVRASITDMPSGRHVHAETETEISAAERSILPFIGLAAAICLYVATEIGISNWLVRYLSASPVTTATAVLALFWGGLSLGRLLSNWVAERLNYVLFTGGCSLLMAAAIVAAVASPFLWLSALLFGLAGLFSGPIYPMIMAIGGNIYPHRLARLSGMLASAAVVGSIVYPPLMGLTAASLGLGVGIIGAGLLGVPAAAAVFAASALSSKRGAAVPAPEALDLRQ